MDWLKKVKNIISENKRKKNEYLDIGSLGITDLSVLPELFRCTHLKTLILGNSWWDPEKQTTVYSKNAEDLNDFDSIPKEISNLKNLETLIIGDAYEVGSSIGDIEFLRGLQNIEYLCVNQVDIESLSVLQNLSKLKILDLSETKTSDYSVIASLRNIEFLDLFGCKIYSLQGFQNLTNLRKLDLRSTPVDSIFYLESLTKIKDLYLGQSRISDLTPLSSLPQLENLDLNNLTHIDIEQIKSLKNLELLNLTGTKLSDYSVVENLKNLRVLDLSENGIRDISFLKKNRQLEKLSIKKNLIEDLTPVVDHNNLLDLDISENSIIEIPKAFFENGLEPNNLPRYYFYQEKQQKTIEYRDNPVESPPIEILEQGLGSVLDWYSASKQRLNEIKVILIGDPKAGKTSLLRRLKYDTFSENEVQTDGINIEHVHFKDCKPFQKQSLLVGLTAHFWDFGGQEILNSTHQFFLTKRSLYVLVLDARKDTNISSQVRQWVKRIIATGGNSSIIIVANQIDVNKGFGFENEYELRKEFPQIEAFVKASCKTNEGIEEIKNLLEELIPKAELFETTIDERWISIKEKLQSETSSDHFLDETRFKEICVSHSLLDTKQQKNAIRFLHDLGLVLHFQDLNENLSEYYVLDPYWITYGVYQILTSSLAGLLKGEIDMGELEYIINREEDKESIYKPINYKKITYSYNQRRFLVDILNQFKLCFYLPNQDKFIIPDLLDTNEPSDITKPIRYDEEAIRFTYRYSYLPKTILPNFMVEFHKRLDYKWRTGCTLKYGDVNALVSNYENKISITVSGPYKQRREFLGTIRVVLDSINDELSESPDRLIPLPEVNVFADYDELLEREKDGEQYYRIYKPKKAKFEISKLLEGIPNNHMLRSLNNKINEVLDNQERLAESIEFQFQKLVELSGDSKQMEVLISSLDEIPKKIQEEISADFQRKISEIVGANNRFLVPEIVRAIERMRETDKTQVKLKLGIPLISVLGINLEGEFDIKKWSQEMYSKYEVKLFKLMGLL